MLRSGAQYLEALRDGRTVYLGSEKVRDVTTHPAFRNTAKSFARIYDAKMAPANRAAMCFQEGDEWFSNWYLVPKSRDDLQRRAEAHRRVAAQTHGLLGRSMDHVASYLTGMRMRPEFFDEARAGCGAHFARYYEHMKKNDLFACYLILTPQGARTKSSGNRSDDPNPMLKIVREDDDGIVLSGVKALGTSAVFADEAWIGNVLPLAPDQKQQAVTCAIPLNAPGVEIWARKSIEQHAGGRISGYFSSQYDESDAMLVLKEVKIPWERVFIYDDALLSREIYFKTPAHTMGNHQSAIRFAEKMKLLNGIAYKAAQVNGVLEIPAVQQTLGRLAAAESALLALVDAQIDQHERMMPGYVNVNRRYVYASMQWSTHNYYEIAETVKELLGAAPFQMPADESFFEAPDLKATFDKYWLSAGASATERYHFIKLAWDLLGSDFGGRQSHYERFYGGPAHMNEMYNFWNSPWRERGAAIDDIMRQMQPAGIAQDAAE